MQRAMLFRTALLVAVHGLAGASARPSSARRHDALLRRRSPILMEDAGPKVTPRLPDPPLAVHAGPPETLSALRSKVGQFEMHISTMKASHEKMLQLHKEQYENLLQAKQQATRDEAVRAVEQAKQVGLIAKRNAELRAIAEDMQEDTDLMERQWDMLSTNLSTAMEVTNFALKRSRETDRSSTLKVLKAIDDAERRRMEILEHKGRLQEISAASDKSATSPRVPPQVSLLQQGRRLVKAQDPKDRHLLQNVAAVLGDVDKDYKESELALRDKYRSLFKREDQRLAQVHAEQANITATRAKLVNTQNRLIASIQRLQSLNTQLLERHKSMRMYLDQLGIRGLQHSNDHIVIPGGVRQDYASDTTTSQPM